MKVLIDDKIPYIKAAAEWLLGHVDYLPGNAFAGSRQLAEADALIIRTRTRCNEAMPGADSRVKFIATATIGYDHLDTDCLQRRGIAWTNCPGCNATSVAQYVRNAILQAPDTAPAPTVGIVGYGHVGKAVRQAVEAIGCRVLLNDPPLEETSPIPGETFISLQEIAKQCDIITFHTPLTAEGPHPTMHLANQAFFASLRRKPLIINAARGGVVDEQALLRAYSEGLVSQMVIDTWEGEPRINQELLSKAFIATPHIAGYSADGKSNATRMALRAVCRHFGIAIDDEEKFLALTAPPSLPADVQPSGDAVRDALTLYDPLLDTARLKANPDTFEAQRGNYPLRRESFGK